MENALVFCHADPDGYCSAAIVKRHNPKVWVIPMGSGPSLPKDKLRKGEPIYILDMSFELEDMQYLCANHPIVYINHHKEVTDRLLAAGLKFDGLWEDGIAACELTWKFLFPNQPAPRAVQWIGDFDTWTDKYEESVPFNYGLGLLNIRPGLSSDATWKKLLDDDTALLFGTLNRGRSIMQYTNLLYKEYANDIAYVTELDGKRFMTMNIRGVVSLAFKYCDTSDCDGVMIYRWVNNLKKYRVSIFSSANSNHDIDLSSVAAKFGGSGHPGAAGFPCATLPFEQRGIPGKLPPVPTQDPYAESFNFTDDDPIADAYASNRFRADAYDAAFSTILCGYPAVGANSPYISGKSIAALNTLYAKLGITFAWINAGCYRIVIRPLYIDVDLSEIKRMLGGEMVGRNLVAYTKELPFTLQKHEM